MDTVRLLADTSGEPVLPGTPVLRMETTKSTGTFDGAWWLRRRDLRSRLSGLLTALTARLGPIARVGLDASDWDETPGHLFVDRHMVRIGWSAVRDNIVIVTRGDQDHFLFQVIPPGTGPGPAYAAMDMAVQDDNGVSAERILAATGITRPTGPTHCRVLPAEPGRHTRVSTAARDPGRTSDDRPGFSRAVCFPDRSGPGPSST
ncbi:DUF5994 family protein [Streptomyces sp. Ag109_O5-10]|uniref:DUF5994 family protein n=1 Tax=Streptomyces sp. Ag109_O5-10 TaxID=1855349 RepID=UPI000894B874|nr:DUF5994 family protein [Streptomyces sp. Ag109_O5-10]SEE21972.1 hypothetical protein SAMN05216533_1706 [Streptomyces sp. Ag109_O5-10]